MVLILREFEGQPGGAERLMTVLRQHAAAMIRDSLAKAVVVCQRTDVATGVLWIQHHGGVTVPAVDADQALPSVESGVIARAAGPVRLELVDAMYQFPLPDCGLWGLETYDDDATRALLKVSQLAASDRRVAGMTIYRTIETPSRTLAFLALARSVSPSVHLGLDAGCCDGTLRVYPLRVSSTIGRLTPGTRCGSPFTRYPRAAFWARLSASPRESAPMRPVLETETSRSA